MQIKHTLYYFEDSEVYNSTEGINEIGRHIKRDKVCDFLINVNEMCGCLLENIDVFT